MPHRTIQNPPTQLSRYIKAAERLCALNATGLYPNKKHRMSQSPGAGLDPHQRTFVKLLQQNVGSYRTREVFSDFCELIAIAISNTVDRQQYETREVRYMALIAKYTKEQAYRFRSMYQELLLSLSRDMCDSLGTILIALELENHGKGQFLTPFSLCQLMARLNLIGIDRPIRDKGFFTLNEPAVGGGAMVIAAADFVRQQGFNYQETMHVIAQDIDSTAVHMSYIQFSLLHIPAVVVHGDMLQPDKTWGEWKTPAHMMGLWDRRLRRADEEQFVSTPYNPEVVNLPLSQIASVSAPRTRNRAA